MLNYNVLINASNFTAISDEHVRIFFIVLFSVVTLFVIFGWIQYTRKELRKGASKAEVGRYFLMRLSIAILIAAVFFVLKSFL